MTITDPDMRFMGFGLARIREEGAPAHPEDIYEHCGCDECEHRWQKQLKAYNDYHLRG